MQTEIKSSIRFGDLYGAFGPKGVVAMAWWLGALHADRIRQEQHSFPFLQITGLPGSGKGLLIQYLWKLVGQESFTSCAPDYASRAGRARVLANAGKQVVVYEPLGLSGPESDWSDELKPLYSPGAEIFALRQGIETVGFHGAILISADQTVQCSAAVNSRMVIVDLSAPHTPATKSHTAELQQLSAEQAGAFSRILKLREDRVIASLQERVPTYTDALLGECGEQLSRRAALNCSQLLALVDVLSEFLSLPDSSREAAISEVKDMAFLESLPF